MADRHAVPPVGYVLNKFPVLSETFVLNELLALEARGVPLHIFALERPNDPRFHDGLSKLKARVSYVPGYLEPDRLLAHHRRLARRAPRRYLGTLAAAARRPATLSRFLQAGYVANEARRLRLTHLHAHFANRATTVASLAAKAAGIPFSFTAHAVDIYRSDVNAKLLEDKIADAKFVVTVSDYNKSHLAGYANGSAGKIVRIYNGIDLSRFTPVGAAHREPPTIVTVARLVEKKGHKVLIEACRLLHERGVPFRSWIIGKGMLRSPLERQIRQAGLDEQVRLLGPLNQLEVLECYRQADILALPCLVAADGNRDGLPVSIVEALACGLPVVTTRMDGITEAVRDRHNGLLVPSGDAGSLADALEALIGDPELRDRLAANTRLSVEFLFDLNRSVAELHGLMDGRAA